MMHGPVNVKCNILIVNSVIVIFGHYNYNCNSKDACAFVGHVATIEN
jgi:hypothetical protein